MAHKEIFLFCSTDRSDRETEHKAVLMVFWLVGWVFFTFQFCCYAKLLQAALMAMHNMLHKKGEKLGH